ncbi:MAG: aminotransferase class V-fold PLP-dependent enzyme [Bacteroidetes bacterium]|nr:MAG: aminotransferase class V-fold PLP-dependent enzyme [Bacteroidota bacterium]
MLDISLIRSQTKGTSQIIHLNNAGCALPPDSVLQKMQNYLTEESTFGGYETAQKYATEFRKGYDLLAKLINCEPSEIAMCESATVAWDRVFYSLPFQTGDRILTSHVEYGSNFIAYLQIAKRTGAKIEIIPNDKFGQVCIESLEKMLDSKVKLISITHIPTNGGLVNPAEKIGQIAKKHNIWYLLDACQSVGQMPIDVQKIGCDMLTATGRKYMRAPRGTGFLFISKKLKEIEPLSLALGSAFWDSENSYKITENAARFELFEASYAARLGMNEAVEYMLDLGLENIWQRIQDLSGFLRNKLSQIKGVQVHDLGEVKCGIVTFTMQNQAAAQIQNKLSKAGVNINFTTLNSTLTDMKARNLTELLRASVHYYNTESEIEVLCNLLENIDRLS